MKKKYETEEDIISVVKSFEDGTIPHDKWKHAEHLTIALYYLSKHDIDTATEKMRNGIFNFLRSFGVDLGKEMPHHETLTIFWMRTLAEFNKSKNGSCLLDKANEVINIYDKDCPLKFYSRQYLFSDEARASFVPGDLPQSHFH